MTEPTTGLDNGAVAGSAGKPAVEGAPARVPLEPQTFVLRPPAPIRAFAIASIAAVAGAVVIVLSGHLAVTVLGVALLAVALLLALLAVSLPRRLRSVVRVDADGIAVTRAGRTGRLAWSSIDRVQESGRQLIAVAAGDERDLAISAPGVRGPSYARLLGVIKQGLDVSRGYGA